MKWLRFILLPLVAYSPFVVESVLAAPESPGAAKITVNVLGRVNRQDRFTLPEGATALDAFAAAGGAANFANLKKARVLRKTADK